MTASLTSTGRWKARKPEDVGMNQAVLDEMKEYVEDYGMRSILVIKDGYKIWEWHHNGRDRAAAIYSCTKSILSAIVGIAVKKGIIRDVRQSIAPYFSNVDGVNLDALHSITVEHLLTMTPGFDWPDFDKLYKPMRASEDWVRYVINRPVVHKPGEAYTYNSGGSHLLSAIVTKAAGCDLAAFADEHLFRPLGIGTLKWSHQHGIREGGTGLHLSARDMAKIGWLYVQGGVWEGKRLLTEQWIAASVKPSAKGLTNYKPPIYGAYGYHWWIGPDYYFAFGHGGQYLAVCHELQLVAVLRRGLSSRNDAILSRKLLDEKIMFAAR